MEQIALIVLAFGAGIVFRLSHVFEESSARVFNRFVIYVSFPALVLVKIHHLQPMSNLAVPVSMAWIHIALAFAFFTLLGPRMGWSRGTIGTLVLTGGLSNTSFVGFPMVEIFFGKENLPVAIILDQLGSFLALSLVGLPLAAYFSGSKRQTLVELFGRVVKFPPFIALILAFLTMPLVFPEWLNLTLDRLGGTLVPIALFSVGLQTKFTSAELKQVRLPLMIGLVFKLAVVPAVLFFFYTKVIGVSDTTTLITIYLAAMAPMITAGIVAVESGLNKPLANLMLGVGIPLSLLTSTCWYFILTR